MTMRECKHDQSVESSFVCLSINENALQFPIVSMETHKKILFFVMLNFEQLCKCTYENWKQNK